MSSTTPDELESLNIYPVKVSENGELSIYKSRKEFNASINEILDTTTLSKIANTKLSELHVTGEGYVQIGNLKVLAKCLRRGKSGSCDVVDIGIIEYVKYQQPSSSQVYN